MCIFVEDEGYRFPAKAGPAASCRCVVVVASAVPIFNQQVFGETHWRSYREFGDLCKAPIGCWGMGHGYMV